MPDIQTQSKEDITKDKSIQVESDITLNIDSQNIDEVAANTLENIKKHENGRLKLLFIVIASILVFVSLLLTALIYYNKSYDLPTASEMIDHISNTISVKSFDVVIGTHLSDEDIILNLKDKYVDYVQFDTRPDFDKAGEYKISVSLTDKLKNKYEYKSCIRVHDVNTEITYEVGKGFSKLVFNDDFSPDYLKISNIPHKTGTSTVNLIGEFNYIPVKVDAVDLTPPVIYGVDDIIYYIGEEKPDFSFSVSAYDEICGNVDVVADMSSVNFKQPDIYPIIFSATDKSGNTSISTSFVTVKYHVRVKLPVSNIRQYPTLPNGCEVVSLAIALKYSGYPVDPLWLYENYMPKSQLYEGNPWTSYIGDATDKGYGCYAPCVVETGNAYLQEINSDKAVYDVSGKKMYEYTNYIDNGIPVILWGLLKMNGDDTVAWGTYANGRYVKWHSFSHCVVLIGYTEDSYIFCDPIYGVVEYDFKSVEDSFKINYSQACIIK